VQSRNQGLALAACEACDPALVADHQLVRETLASLSLPGRLQVYHDRHEWVLDVAHNQQAAVALVAALKQMDALPTRVVIGMMADKAIEAFASEFGEDVSEWIACDVKSGRGSSAAETAERLRSFVDQPVEVVGSVQAALKLAQDKSPDGTRLVVCGSFYVVGPALEWLGLY
jgi:dihydrofolate synthase/folylpolyglutamate synthase